jgi:hypothetical protein
MVRPEAFIFLTQDSSQVSKCVVSKHMQNFGQVG